MMRSRKRWVGIAIGVVLVALGLGCVNYTKQSTLEHHREWAAARGVPAPSKGIFYGGIASIALGVVLGALSLIPKRGG